MKLQEIKTGDLVKFEINGILRNTLNKVVDVTESTIKVQINAPSTALHCSMLVIDKNTNAVKVTGYGGTAIYKISEK
jgi:hypothetical protein